MNLLLLIASVTLMIVGIRYPDQNDGWFLMICAAAGLVIACREFAAAGRDKRRRK